MILFLFLIILKNISIISSQKKLYSIQNNVSDLSLYSASFIEVNLID